MTFDSEQDKKVVVNFLQSASIQGKDAEYVAGLLKRIEAAKIEGEG